MKKKSRPLYEPHLVIREISISPGGEWQPQPNGWSVIQIADGRGYCMIGQRTSALDTGVLLAISGRAGGNIRASQLGKISLNYFTVIPARLPGLVTLGEQHALTAPSGQAESMLRILPPRHSTSEKMQELCANRNGGGLMFRLKLLQLFVEALGGELKPATCIHETNDARERLRIFLKETPSHELAEMDFSDLARNMRCTSRHLTRIFRELVGMSFSDKRAEIRMERARELLATGKSKVVDVALESGYKSLSLFNLMFMRRFGTSPGRWRRKYAMNSGAEN